MSAEQPLSAGMVTALRRHGADWALNESVHASTVLALEERGLIEVDWRHELPSRPGHKTVGSYRYGRLTAAGNAYLARLEPTGAQRV